MKTKMLSLTMVILMLLSLAACSGSDSGTTKNPSATPKPSDTTDTQTGDGTAQSDTQSGDDTAPSDTPENEVEMKFFYEDLDVSQFDPSKFDGTFNLSNDIAVQLPIDGEKILAAGYTLTTMDGVDLLENGLDTPIEGEIEQLIQSKTVYLTKQGQTPHSYEKFYPWFREESNTFRMIFDKKDFSMELGTGAGCLGIFPSGSVKEPAAAEDVINILGQPSKIIHMVFENDLGNYMSYGGSFDLCYEYDDYTLRFNFMEVITPKLNNYTFNYGGAMYYGKGAWEEELLNWQDSYHAEIIE